VNIIPTLISLHHDQIAVVNGLWTVFQAVAFAILGFVFSNAYVRSSAWILAFISAGFAVFSIANERAIDRAQTLVVAATAQLEALAAHAETPDALRPVLGAYQAIAADDLAVGHRTFTLLVLAALWVLFAVHRAQARRTSAAQSGP